MNFLRGTKHAFIARTGRFARRVPAPPAIPALVAFIRRVVSNYFRNYGSHSATVLAFYALFSLFPVISAMLAVVSFFFSRSEAQEFVSQFVENLIPAADQSRFIEQILNDLFDRRRTVGTLSVIALLWAGRAIVSANRRIMNRIWEVERPPGFVLGNLFDFLGSLAISTVLMSLIVASAGAQILILGTDVEQHLGRFGDVVNSATRFGPLILSTAVFLFVYRYAANTRVKWRDAVVGAVLAGLAFEILKFAFVLFLTRYTRFDYLYGGFATVIILMVWFQLSAQVVVIGAEIAAETGRSRGKGVLLKWRDWGFVRGGLMGTTMEEQDPIARPRQLDS